MIMKFNEFCEYLDSIDATRSRLEIGNILADLFKNLTDEETQIVCYLMMGRITPKFIDIEFNMSEKTVVSVLTNKRNINKEEFESIRRDKGSVHGAIQKVHGKKNGKDLNITDVYSVLSEISKVSGQGAAGYREELLSELMEKTSSTEFSYIARVISGKLRLGVKEITLLEGALILRDIEDKGALNEVFGFHPDIGYLVSTYIREGMESLPNAPILGVPVLSRLVERVEDFDKVFDRLGIGFIVQNKYDGLRCQAHVGVSYDDAQFEGRVWLDLTKQDANDGLFAYEDEDTDIKLYSRNLEDVTSMYPEIVDALSKSGLESSILDGEVMGWDYESGEYLLFQDTIKRKRKKGIDAAMEAVPLRYFVFDVIKGEKKVRLDSPTSKRLNWVSSVFSSDLASREVAIVDSGYTYINSREELDDAFNSAVENSLEGLIAKDTGNGYMPGKRNFHWIKLKKSMLNSLVDSFDLVVLGYYYGKGRKTELGIGSILVGSRDPEAGVFESVTKIGTGITDSELVEIKKRLDQIGIGDKPEEYDVDKNMYPDVWVVPDVVVSVEADEVSESKIHMSGMQKYGAGMALRFPRLIEFDRDKSPDIADTSELLYKSLNLKKAS